MALNYTQIFGDLGKLIARINSYSSIAATTLPADLTALLTQFSTRWLPEEGIAGLYEGLKDSVTGWRQAVAGFCDSRLLDYSTVLTPLGLDSGAGLDSCLPYLLRQMVQDGQTVKACTAAAGTVAPPAGAVNTGSGQAFVTLVLDGYNPPAAGAAPSVLYAGQQSQFCVPSETMLLECVADSATDGLVEGGELWSWTGGPAYADLDCRAEGSGTGPGLQTANQSGLIAGGDFEAFGGNVPSGWTVVSGTPGVHIFQDTTAGNFFRGTSALKLAGDGATTIQLGTLVAQASLMSKRRYHLCLATKASAMSAPAQLLVSFSGTGYSPVTGDFIEVPGASFPAGWTLFSTFLNMPAPIPSDGTWALNITLTGLGAGVAVWIDSLSLKEATYHGGVGLSVVAGQKRWLKGDRLTFATSNDGAGLFQTFFRRHYLTQLPSVLSGGASAQGYPTLLPVLLVGSAQATETISDGLVV